MTRIRGTKLTSFSAIAAAAALLLQAMLPTLASLEAARAAALERMAAHALCLGAAGAVPGQDDSAPASGRTASHCCVLCGTPGLAAAVIASALPFPAWRPPLASPLPGPEQRATAAAAERRPFRARAPPSA